MEAVQHDNTHCVDEEDAVLKAAVQRDNTQCVDDVPINQSTSLVLFHHHPFSVVFSPLSLLLSPSFLSSFPPLDPSLSFALSFLFLHVSVLVSLIECFVLLFCSILLSSKPSSCLS